MSTSISARQRFAAASRSSSSASVIPDVAQRAELSDEEADAGEPGRRRRLDAVVDRVLAAEAEVAQHEIVGAEFAWGPDARSSRDPDAGVGTEADVERPELPLGRPRLGIEERLERDAVDERDQALGFGVRGRRGSSDGSSSTSRRAR